MIFCSEELAISSRFGGPQRPPNKEKGPQILTPDIRASEVRLIDGEDNRIVTRREAEDMARESGLDLVVMSLDSSPPVVKLIDYGRFKFETEKKAREAKKKQHVVDIKEIKMSVRIDDHDYEVKLHRAQKFLEEGDKVKLTIRLKGREAQHANLVFALANRFIVDLESFGTADNTPRLEGRTMTVNFSPLKK